MKHDVCWDTPGLLSDVNLTLVHQTFVWFWENKSEEEDKNNNNPPTRQLTKNKKWKKKRKKKSTIKSKPRKSFFIFRTLPWQPMFSAALMAEQTSASFYYLQKYQFEILWYQKPLKQKVKLDEVGCWVSWRFAADVPASECGSNLWTRGSGLSSAPSQRGRSHRRPLSAPPRGSLLSWCRVPPPSGTSGGGSGWPRSAEFKKLIIAFSYLQDHSKVSLLVMNSSASGNSCVKSFVAREEEITLMMS